jgi:hypothetical protein
MEKTAKSIKKRAVAQTTPKKRKTTSRKVGMHKRTEPIPHLKKYEVTYYDRDVEKANVEFETPNIHEDVWDALYAAVSAANPRDNMSKTNANFVNDIDYLTWDETGFTAFSGNIMIIAHRVRK